MRRDLSTGFMTGAFSAGWLVLTSLFLNDEHPLRLWSGLAQTLILLGGIAYVVWFYRDELKGKISLKAALKRGMLVSAVVAVCLGAAVGWYTKVHDPFYAEKMIKNSEEYFRKEGKTEQEIQQNSEILRKSFSPGAEVNKTIFGTLFTGFLLSLASGLLGGALVNRKE